MRPPRTTFFSRNLVSSLLRLGGLFARPGLAAGVSVGVCVRVPLFSVFLSLRNARRRRRTKCLKGGPTRRIGSAELISSGAWKAKVAYGLTYSFFASSSLPLMCPCFIGTCFLFFSFSRICLLSGFLPLYRVRFASRLEDCQRKGACGREEEKERTVNAGWLLRGLLSAL